MVSREGPEDGVFFALRLGVMLMAVAAFSRQRHRPSSMARGAYDVLRRFSLRRIARQVALFVFLSMGFVPLIGDGISIASVLAQSFPRRRTLRAACGGARRPRAWMVPLLVSAIRFASLRRTRERRWRCAASASGLRTPSKHPAPASPALLLLLATVAAAVVTAS